MTTRLSFCLGLSLSAMLCGCGSDSAVPDAASAEDDGHVTYLVTGMTERLNIL